MKLMVLDGNSIINRSFYGIRPLTTREGLYTHAVYGFLTTLQRLVDEERPEALCVTFDRREPTFRHEADANYKATRHGMPEELAMQMPVLKQVLDAMSIPRYELAGYEADDLIGTISRKCEASGWDCVVGKGEFSPGEKVVYLEIDTFIPLILADTDGVPPAVSLLAILRPVDTDMALIGKTAEITVHRQVIACKRDLIHPEPDDVAFFQNAGRKHL